MAQDRTRRYQEILLDHRLKTPFAEVDLVTKSRDGVLRLFEVKSWGGDIWGSEIISSAQQRRLERARLFCEARSSSGAAELHLATVQWVGANGLEVEYFPFPL